LVQKETTTREKARKREVRERKRRRSYVAERISGKSATIWALARKGTWKERYKGEKGCKVSEKKWLRKQDKRIRSGWV